MIDTKILRDEDFIIQVTPMLTASKKWDGNVLVNIATSGKNPLNKKDMSDLWHLCRMMCSVIPLMQDDSELMYTLDDYAHNSVDFKDKNKKDNLTIQSKKGNVIKLNFNTKTGGNA